MGCGRAWAPGRARVPTPSFPLEKAQELNLQALGLLVKWHRLVFHQGSCSSPGKQPERRIWDGYE